MTALKVDVAGQPLLRFDGVTKSFGGVQAVKGLTMDIRAGGITGLIGPNGAGKTTIFNLATGFLRPDSGTIHLGDRDITRSRPEKIFALGMGRSFQEMRVFRSLSVYDNLLVAIERRWSLRGGRRTGYQQRIDEILDQIALAPLRKRTAGDLSYAERKLLTLGRIMVSDPRLLLLDEPASGLDDAAKQTLIDVVKRVAAEGRKIVVIEHNLDLIKELVDDVAFLNLGQLMAHGAIDDIISRPDLTELYFGVDVIETVNTGEPLAVDAASVGYRGRRVVTAATLQASCGSLVSLFGHNGAGKTTLLRAICGAIPLMGGSVAVGSTRIPRSRAKVAIVAQGRGVFGGLTVRENLALGVWRTGTRMSDELLEPALEHFPALRERLDDDAGVLSGGQRQMVSIARAILSRPSVLLLDEPSVGLAPMLVEQVLAAVRRLVDRDNIAALLVEQNVRQALRVSDHVYVMKSGRIVADGPPADFSDQERLWQLT